MAELGYFDVFTEECLESRCLVPWSVPVPGGTLLLPVNTVSSVRGEGVTLREGRGGGSSLKPRNKIQRPGPGPGAI